MKQTTRDHTRNIVGAAIRRVRLASRVPVTQQDLSGRLAASGLTLDQSAIARIERGERYVLDYEVAAVAKALRIPVERLYARK